ncbi:response regulator transcription factor [Aquimarina sp. 2201CG5-10]|uniref:response regulator transcription factor n=1 Tax=Aquimarina callyspongiae TaxID=3098150 RepID=UPI002AB3B093|nr:LuxR C-terminal-related transcriptional regulator [Aquimarina sp. 2201CG5-10]MDY8137876.1 LuxR C-terminal-related transcriptional regulator [Aquimarina sp. 2201CG5-10]
MMKIKLILLTLFISCISIHAQNCVSGYVNIDHPDSWEKQIYLSQLSVDEHTNSHNSQIIASVPIQEDGFFAFDKNLFTANSNIYKLYLNPKRKNKLVHKIKNFKLFILSKKDTIFFKKGTSIFSDYTTSNKADLEWQKLKKFESLYESSFAQLDTAQYLMETKGYVKDSLQILLVKLISIKKLDDKNLLEKDIKANPRYYQDLLNELKSSELNPMQYAYLENKLILLSKNVVQQKYSISLLLNGIGLLIIITLLIFYLRSRKKSKSNPSFSLSKQENTIKNLIIEGKSNKEIANELFISLSTVKTHITNIYSKLNISNRKELLLRK